MRIYSKAFAISLMLCVSALPRNGHAQVQQEMHNLLSGLCLDADTRTLGNNGTIVQVWRCGGVNNQRWRFRPDFTIVNVQSGRCLDANAPTVHQDGGKVQLWDCWGGPMQKWRQSGGLFHNMADESKCLDANAPTAGQNGGKVQVWGCWGGPMQSWIPSPIVSETMTDRCSGDVLFGDSPITGRPKRLLIRGPSGWTNWTEVFQQTLDDGHFVRWWCHSTTGNWADPGTWRFRVITESCGS
jgi:hypothetical protein